ncbi:MAG: hypothetical protein RLP15_12235 [Cryomorphaceae bacterium]
MLLLLSSSAQSQILPDSITVRERRLGYDLFQGPMQIGNNRTKAMMAKCPESLNYYGNGKRIENVGVLFTAIGVVAAGTAIGNYYTNGKTPEQSALIIPGALLVGLGIPIYFSGVKKVKLGVALYNHRCVEP